MDGVWLRKNKGSTAAVFVHGFLSDGERAWRPKGAPSWPELLLGEQALQEISVYTYSYDTNVFSRDYSISDVVDDLKERMLLDGIRDYQRVLFVCHSMGGIVVRKLIVSRFDDFFERKTHLGLFLVASPSLGSEYANWFQLFAKLLGHAQAKVLEFTKTNQWLNDLDKDFRNLKEKQRLPISGKELVEHHFSADHPYLRLSPIVESVSAARYFGEQIRIAKSDHFNIAKPAGPRSLQHRLLCEFASTFMGVRDEAPIGDGPEPTFIEVNAVPSTNDESHKLLANGQRPPFILLAWNQTNGKGKLGRTWQGGTGVLTATWNYAFSLDRSGPEVMGLLHVVSALAVRDAVVELNKGLVDVKVKWPNDVLIGAKKVAGILIEVRKDIAGKVATIGVGMNVCRIPTITDRRQYALPPASVFTDFDDDHSREAHVEAAVKAITPHLERRIRLLTEMRGLGGQRTEFEKHDFSLDRVVTVLSPDGSMTATGYNRGISAHGQLVIEFANGKRKEYNTGEVTSLSANDTPDVDAPHPNPRAPVEHVDGKRLHKVLSPLAGTFLRAPGPGQPPLVNKGDKVSEGQAICIVEAMKILNEIEADVAGTIVECLATNGHAVEYGQGLFVIQLD